MLSGPDRVPDWGLGPHIRGEKLEAIRLRVKAETGGLGYGLRVRLEAKA